MEEKVARRWKWTWPRSVPLHIVIGGVVAGLFALAISGKIEASHLVTAFLALIGTVVGALLAFRLNESREDLKEARRRKGALTRGLIVLIEQEASLQNLWDDHLGRWEGRPDKGVNLPALRPPDYGALKQDLGELQFLLEDDTDNSAGNLALTVLRVDRTFHQALSALRLRSDFHVDVLQAEIAKRGLNRRSFTQAEARKELGEIIFDRINNETENVYGLFREALQTMPAAQAELHALARSLFPGVKFVKTDRGPKRAAPASK